MSTIPTVEFEKNALIDSFKKKYTLKTVSDEFTGISNLRFESQNIFNANVDDTDFNSLTESEINRIKQSVRRYKSDVAEMRSIFSEINSSRPQSKYEILEEMMRDQAYKKTIEASHSSRLDGFLIGESTPEGKLQFFIRVVFQNYSHKREMSGFRFLLLTNDDKRFCLDKNNIISTRHDSTIREDWDVFLDTTLINIPTNIIEQAFVNGTRISVRFDGLDIRGSLSLESNNPAKVFRLLVNNSLKDEEIDDLYDDLNERQKIEEIREREELQKREKEEAKRRIYSLKNELSHIADRIRYLKINEFDTLERLIKTPLELSPINELKQLCDNNSIQSDLMDYINSLSDHFNTSTILSDIERLRKKDKLITKSKLYIKYSRVVAIIAFIVSLIWPSLVSNILFWISLTIYIILLIISYGKLTYGTEASRFIEAFPKEVHNKHSFNQLSN